MLEAPFARESGVAFALLIFLVWFESMVVYISGRSKAATPTHNPTEMAADGRGSAGSNEGLRIHRLLRNDLHELLWFTSL
jgi:hypothetical protein